MEDLRSEISSRSTSQKKNRTTRFKKKDRLVLTDLKFALYIFFCFLH
ncbi:hypothetical protein [Methylacidiphilum sp. Yel]|nr:hypothetical protein [Methylacidiphilum sp. Yel]